MTPQEIIKGNKLIAEFMGILYGLKLNSLDLPTSESKCRIHRYDSIDDDTEGLHINHTKFHSSWDWLMPVIGKISSQCEEPEELDNLKYALLTNNIEIGRAHV